MWVWPTEYWIMVTRSLQGTTLILTAAVLWGTTGTAQSFAPLALSSYWVGAFRLLVAGLFFVPWVLAFHAPALTHTGWRRLPWKAIAVAAFSMAAYNLAFFAGVRSVGVGVGTAIALGSGPLWAGALQTVIDRRIPSRHWWLAVTTAVAGLVIAAWHSSGPEPLRYGGIALCLISGAGYAVYAFTTKRIVSQTSAGVATAVIFMLAALIASPLAALLAGPPQVTADDAVVLLWLGVVATGVAYLLFSVGLRYVSSATGVALALAEPVAAVCLAIVVIGERPGMATLLGMGMVLIGLGLLVRSEVD